MITNTIGIIVIILLTLSIISDRIYIYQYKKYVKVIQRQNELLILIHETEKPLSRMVARIFENLDKNSPPEKE